MNTADHIHLWISRGFQTRTMQLAKLLYMNKVELEETGGHDMCTEDATFKFPPPPTPCCGGLSGG